MSKAELTVKLKWPTIPGIQPGQSFAPRIRPDTKWTISPRPFGSMGHAATIKPWALPDNYLTVFVEARCLATDNNAVDFILDIKDTTLVLSETVLHTLFKLGIIKKNPGDLMPNVLLYTLADPNLKIRLLKDIHNNWTLYIPIDDE